MVLIKILPYSFFDWCESMPLGAWLKQAMWGFAIVETVHIMALAVLLGTMVVVDLRLLGLGLKRMPTEELDRLLRPWFWGFVLYDGRVGPMPVYGGSREAEQERTICL